MRGAARIATGRFASCPDFHARDVTHATFCAGPYEQTVRCRDFTGRDVPWYSAKDSAEALLAGRQFAMLACYLRDGDRVFETYWTAGRSFEAVAPSLRVAGHDRIRRQEHWEDSPAGWPQGWNVDPSLLRTEGTAGRPVGRLPAGHSDDLGNADARRGAQQRRGCRAS